MHLKSITCAVLGYIYCDIDDWLRSLVITVAPITPELIGKKPITSHQSQPEFASFFPTIDNAE